jgi:hypothetical protein
MKHISKMNKSELANQFFYNFHFLPLSVRPVLLIASLPDNSYGGPKLRALQVILRIGMRRTSIGESEFLLFNRLLITGNRLLTVGEEDLRKRRVRSTVAAFAVLKCLFDRVNVVQKDGVQASQPHPGG